MILSYVCVGFELTTVARVVFFQTETTVARVVIFICQIRPVLEFCYVLLYSIEHNSIYYFKNVNEQHFFCWMPSYE